MSETKWTPGPWIWVGYDIKTRERRHTTHYHRDGDWENTEPMEAGGSLVSKPMWDAAQDDDARCYVPEIIQTDSGVYGPHGPDRHLIAAAPELYEAIEHVLESLQYGEPDIDINRLCAALAKARGESIEAAFKKPSDHGEDGE